MLKQRIIIGVIGFLFIVFVLVMGNLTLGVVLSLIAMLALYELYHALEILKSNPGLAALGFLFCAAVFLMQLHGIIWGDFDTLAVAGRVVPALCIYTLAIAVYVVAAFGKTRFVTAATSVFAAMYITVLFAHILLIRQSQFGEVLVWPAFLAAWATDTFAFLFGLTMGRHKLIPNVSPKKTVEGAVGGVFGCVFIMVVYGFVCQSLGYGVDFSNLTVFAIASSAISQFGDLFASCIKREFGVKDYGNILPGHGGILDRFDSVLLVAPFLYYYTMVLPILN